MKDYLKTFTLPVWIRAFVFLIVLDILIILFPEYLSFKNKSSATTIIIVNAFILWFYSFSYCSLFIKEFREKYIKEQKEETKNKNGFMRFISLLAVLVSIAYPFLIIFNAIDNSVKPSRYIFVSFIYAPFITIMYLFGIRKTLETNHVTYAIICNVSIAAGMYLNFSEAENHKIVSHFLYIGGMVLLTLALERNSKKVENEKMQVLMEKPYEPLIKPKGPWPPGVKGICYASPGHSYIYKIYITDKGMHFARICGTIYNKESGTVMQLISIASFFSPLAYRAVLKRIEKRQETEKKYDELIGFDENFLWMHKKNFSVPFDQISKLTFKIHESKNQYIGLAFLIIENHKGKKKKLIVEDILDIRYVKELVGSIKANVEVIDPIANHQLISA